MTADLYLMHLRPDAQRLATWAARNRLLDRSGDLGYAFHGLLQAVFGAAAPSVYRYIDADQGLLAYTSMTPDELFRAVALTPPDTAAALGLGATHLRTGLNVRPMPCSWPIGKQLGFECRVRPVIRESKTGNERDAFLAALKKKSDGDRLDRGEVYGEWLATQFSRQSGTQLLNTQMTSFRLLDVMRRTQKGPNSEAPRRTRAVGGPDVVLTGQLRVTDSEAFDAMVRRGIGRHRAFGFGMLLLKPAGLNG
jgi:CRISPR system Cascade subunit CasE